MLDRPGLKPTFSQFVLTETANKNQKERLLSNDYIWIHFYYLYIRGMIDNTTTYNYKTRHCIAIRKKMRDNCDGGSGNTKFETKMQMLFSITFVVHHGIFIRIKSVSRVGRLPSASEGWVVATKRWTPERRITTSAR